MQLGLDGRVVLGGDSSAFLFINNSKKMRTNSYLHTLINKHEFTNILDDQLER